MPAIAKVGISAAGVTMNLSDPALLTAMGEAIRPVLARVVGSTRDLVRQESGWDDEVFWASVLLAGRSTDDGLR